MVLPKVLKVAVEQTAFNFDKLYSYSFPSSLGAVECGCRVMVPFGRGNRKLQGIVIGIELQTLDNGENREKQYNKLKPIIEVLDEQPLVNQEQIKLALWMKERTFCSVFDAIKSMIPTGFYLRIKPTYIINGEIPEDVSGGEYSALRHIATAPKGMEHDKILKYMGWSEDSNHIQSLVNKNYVIRKDSAFQRIGDATIRMVRINFLDDELDEAIFLAKLSEKQKRVVNLLRESGDVSLKEIGYFCSVTPAVVNAVVKKGIASYYDAEILRTPKYNGVVNAEPAQLNDEQKQAFDELFGLYKSDKAEATLLYGITGSGKTQVYMNLINEVLKDEKQVLVLVPEISLTPQMTSLFFNRFGNDVAVLHSGLALGERMDEWKRIKRGEAKIAVGTRSAVFAPFINLGLIIMDEEQEHSYKSDSNPRYHARDVAKFRCVYNKALLVLTSATPSIETYHLAKIGRYNFQELPSRFGIAELPEVEVVDMREYEGMLDGVVSERLKDEIVKILEVGGQVILLLNRRGYNTFVSCRSCGEVITCPSCSISLTFHRANHRLMCHYCGHSEPFVEKCPHCESDKVRYSGLGTQRVEEELQELFPNERILRMDTDTTMSRSSYETKFGDFAKGEYSIMLGTQMVAKGLDFPSVGLVGVLTADQAIYGEDFRSFETAFSLLTQVTGRAGRRDAHGKAIIQTYSPDNYVIELASKQDYPAFYETEIAMRRMMKYPPFTDITLFGFVGINEAEVRGASFALLKMLKKEAGGEFSHVPIIVLDPSPAMVNRMAGKFRYKLLIKSVNNKEMRVLLSKLIIDFNRINEFKNVTLFVDINPSRIM